MEASWSSAQCWHARFPCLPMQHGCGFHLRGTQDARIARDNDAIKRAINEYDEALEAYIPGREGSGDEGQGQESRGAPAGGAGASGGLLG